MKPIFVQLQCAPGKTYEVADEIYRKLNEAFSPDQLEVVNDSASHAGHSGDDGTGETHFNVSIRAYAK